MPGIAATARRRRLVELPRELGVEPASLPGPLIALAATEEGGRRPPIHLGGDLHAGHPESGEGVLPRRDPLLDTARITLLLDDPAGERIETTASRGIWCLALRGVRRESSALFLIADRDGGLRVWLLLPPARTLVGRAHLWLPSLPPPP